MENELSVLENILSNGRLLRFFAGVGICVGVDSIFLYIWMLKEDLI